MSKKETKAKKLLESVGKAKDDYFNFDVTNRCWKCRNNWRNKY